MTESDLRFTDPSPRIHATAQLKNCRVGRYASIGERTILREVELGDFSYFERHAEAIYCAIGKFCSIAANTRLNALEHPLERTTTHKVSYRPNEYFRYLGMDKEFRDRRRSKRVTIGHDVWIGHGAVVLPSIAIATGAVVGANAVVTRDVGPYEIVAGAPARPLRKRFSPQLTERLLESRWWDWLDEKLFAAIPDMQTLPVEAWLEKWGG